MWQLKSAQAFFLDYFTWEQHGPTSVNIEGSFLSLKEQRCLIPQTSGTPPLILDVQGRKSLILPKFTRKPQALAQLCLQLPARFVHFCLQFCCCAHVSWPVNASRGLYYFQTLDRLRKKKWFFSIRNCKSCMYLMNVELCAVGCCLAGGITFLLNPWRFQARKFSHLFSFNKFSPSYTQGQLWWHQSSTYTFFLSVHFLNLFIPL